MPESDEQKQQREFEKALLVYRRNCTIMNDKRECSSSIVNTLQPENVILLRFEYDGLKKDTGSEVQHNLQSRGPEGTTKHKDDGVMWCRWTVPQNDKKSKIRQKILKNAPRHETSIKISKSDPEDRNWTANVNENDRTEAELNVVVERAAANELQKFWKRRLRKCARIEPVLLIVSSEQNVARPPRTNYRPANPPPSPPQLIYRMFSISLTLSKQILKISTVLNSQHWRVDCGDCWLEARKFRKVTSFASFYPEFYRLPLRCSLLITSSPKLFFSLFTATVTLPRWRQDFLNIFVEFLCFHGWKCEYRI